MRIAVRFLLLFLASLAFAQKSSDRQKPLVFTHVTVIDATGAPEQPDRTVVVSKGHITTIGESSKVQVPQDADVVDARGKFLIPGLWDMHVHWSDEDYLPLFIANGVTGIRQMWGSDEHHRWRDQIEKGELVGPHQVIASAIVDGPKPLWPGSVSVATEAEARRAVKEAKEQGADFVKVYSFLPREEYFAIADEAEKQGISFAGHVPFGVSVEEASDAGQRTIEHLIGMASSCSSRADEFHRLEQEDLAEMIASGKPSLGGGTHMASVESAWLDSYSPEKCRAVFEKLKKNGTWVCPTLVIFRTMAMASDPILLKDERLRYVPRDLRTSWGPDSVLFKLAAQNSGYAKTQYRYYLQMVAAINRAGVGILAGTDVSNPFSFPGFSLHDELAHYVEAGLSPMAALQTATLNPARFLGQQEEMGTIEAGKIADLVLLDADPLVDIANTTKINAVILGGKLYARGSLDQMLAHAEALASRKSIAELLLQTINNEGIESAIKQYHELRSSQPTAYVFRESELNDLGYQLLQAQKIKAAVEILKLNVEIYPKSFNTYDSLGEAFMANGQKDLAIQNYKKSLELNPNNTNASEMLKKLSNQ